MRILVVDDDILILRALVRRFERSGFQTVTASGVEEAMSALQLMVGTNTAPDLIVSDVEMQDGTGFELADRVNRLMIVAPIFVFMTASMLPWKQDEAVRLSADLIDKRDLTYLAKAIKCVVPEAEKGSPSN